MIKTTTALAVAALAAVAIAGPASSQQPRAWTQEAAPFHIIGPVYSVGSEGLAVFLIHTKDGNILLDAGVPQIATQIENNIKTLGFNLKDTKILLNSHAHFDHSGGLAQIKRDTGAKVIASALDTPSLENGKYLGSENVHSMDSIPVKVDQQVKDGEKISLGGLTLTANITPGHTKGCTSWTLPFTDAGAKHTAIFFCSATVAANHLYPKEQYPGIIADYRSTFVKARKIDADIYFAPHSEFFDMASKKAKLAAGAKPNPFINPGEFHAAIDKFEADFNSDLAKQQKAAAKSSRAARIAALKAAAKERILILDGAWGVMIQRRKLDEADFRGERFADHNGQMKGNNDVLCLTRPDIIAELHDAYYAAGADISETNTFSSTWIAQEDYGLQSSVRDINLAGARIAREAADRWTAKEPHKPRFVAGSIGPLNKMLSMSSDVNDPGARTVTFDQVYDAYREQVRALHEGGVDLFLIETITDTLNCKACIKAILDLQDEGYEPLPIWISGTITDRSGRTLSGQTAEAFWNSVKHAKPFAIGFNCALGADLMRPHIAELARVADTLVAAYPNAGLPNAFGDYDETPDQTGHELHQWAKDGIVNILGGCCGTTPDHIKHVADEVKGVAPREIPERPKAMRLAGLEPFELA